MEKKIEVTYGYRIEDENGKVIEYVKGYSGNGYCYKDKKAYESGKGICYIPENDDTEEADEICHYTKVDFVKLVGGEDFKALADLVFGIVDWQFPETYWYECEIDDEDLEYFGIDKEKWYKLVGETME